MKQARIFNALAALVMVIIWLAITGLGGPTFGKISEVSTNDKSTFLPASSESTQVGDLIEEFSDGKGIPAIIAGEVGEVDDSALDATQALTER